MSAASSPADPDPAVRPQLRKLVPAALLAALCFAVGSNLGGVGRSTAARLDLFGRGVVIPGGWVIVIVIALTIVFVVTGVLVSRSVGRELARVSSARAGLAVGSTIRLLCVIVGYLTVGLGVLALLQVNLGNLLVGGAVTGVVVGIAAQQTLGNFFAGLVLLFARPYVPGQRVKIRSGALGGPFEGVIISAGLVYTVIDTDEEGLISLPNSGVLGSAIGPAPDKVDNAPQTAIDEPEERP